MNDVLMGEYEIYCNQEKTEWVLVDKLASNERKFTDLQDLMAYLESEIEHVVIEGE